MTAKETAEFTAMCALFLLIISVPMSLINFIWTEDIQMLKITATLVVIILFGWVVMKFNKTI